MTITGTPHPTSLPYSLTSDAGEPWDHAAAVRGHAWKAAEEEQVTEEEDEDEDEEDEDEDDEEDEETEDAEASTA